MNRDISLKQLEETPMWDLIVIGGGATGLGVAVDAASRGYKILLLEQSDFAKGTSSRSTKLLHGGVRYLAQGNIRLVREALKERGCVLQNAPHLSGRQAFIIPVYTWWDRWKYAIGLKVYDILAGRQQIGHSSFLRKTKVLERMPGVRKDGLKGGVLYYDGQFDDARMAISLASTAEDYGGTVINYMQVRRLLKDKTGRLNGLVTLDLESGHRHTLRSKGVVNATGVFVDEVHKMDTGGDQKSVQPSQGVHLVLPSRFLLTTQNALMIPATDDGRVLFLVPWHHHLLMGTTDTLLESHTLEPKALDQEVEFILRNAQKYLAEAPGREDVLSVFAGLRPLALPARASGGTKGKKQATKDISRSHILQVSDSGLITITGGKRTTYRIMAEKTVDKAISVAGLPRQSCRTMNLKIHGWCNQSVDQETASNVYGSDSSAIKALVVAEPALERKLDEAWPYTAAEVVWAVRKEMARTVDDVLSRRLRVLFLDARAAIRMAPAVAHIMQQELQQDDRWKQRQIDDFVNLASAYVLTKGRTMHGSSTVG